jgi:predicted CoA-binding protein
LGKKGRAPSVLILPSLSFALSTKAMTTHPHERVVVLGASDKPDRYSHRAQILLQKHGHHVIPVHPRLNQIEGIPVVPELGAVTGHVDTITVYVGPAISSDLAKSFIQLRPRRVIFNPGAENPALASQLQGAGISTEDACTLVLLSTGAY